MERDLLCRYGVGLWKLDIRVGWRARAKREIAFFFLFLSGYSEGFFLFIYIGYLEG